MPEKPCNKHWDNTRGSISRVVLHCFADSKEKSDWDVLLHLFVNDRQL